MSVFSGALLKVPVWAWVELFQITFGAELTLKTYSSSCASLCSTSLLIFARKRVEKLQKTASSAIGVADKPVG